MKTLSAVIAVALMLAFLVPIALKLKEPALFGVMAIGVVMMLIDTWQSLQGRDS